MDKLTILLIGIILVLTGIIVNTAYSEECGDWVNCNMNSPSFDGICCRICFIPELDYREWVCERVSNDKGFTAEEKKALPQNFEFELDEDVDGLIDNYVKGEEE